VAYKEDEKGAYRVSVGKQKDLEDVGVSGRMMFKLMIKKLV
jgi:hypothetical protein